MRVSRGRRLLGVVTAGLLVAATWEMAGAAEAADATPIPVEGNATCGELGDLVGLSGWTEFYKVEPVQSGSHTSGGLTVSWTVRDTSEGPVFDWTSNFDIRGVFVKGGNTGGYLYYYPPGTRADSGLHAPLNPSGTWAGLSHISFCYNPAQQTTSTPSTQATSSSTGGTSSTSGPTTPTTAATSSTSGSTTPPTGPTTPPDTARVGDTVSATTATTGRLEVLETTVTASSSTLSGSVETLPFTGMSDGAVGGVAFALLMLGGLVLLSVRRRRDDADVVAVGWYSRLRFYDLKFR